MFRAQVKTALHAPRATLPGAGWDVLSKVLKSGYMIPPLIVNYRWSKPAFEHQVIRFFPFIPKDNVSKYKLSRTARRANYRMFTYVDLNTLPHFDLYST